MVSFYALRPQRCRSNVAVMQCGGHASGTSTCTGRAVGVVLIFFRAHKNPLGKRHAAGSESANPHKVAAVRMPTLGPMTTDVAFSTGADDH